MSDYRVLVEKTDAGFVLRIPELCLLEEAEDLSLGWAAIEARRDQIIEQHRRLGVEAQLPPSAVAVEKEERRDLRRFAVKAMVVVIAVSIAAGATATAFSYAVRDPLRKVGQRLGRAAAAQLTAGLREGASELSEPQKLAAFRAALAEAAPALQPYARDIRTALDMQCQPPAQVR